jgi:hypothetical protein
MKALSEENNPFSVSTTPVTVYKPVFSNSSYAFSAQGWFNNARSIV